MAKVTRIKASDPGKGKDDALDTVKKAVKKTSKTAKASKSSKATKTTKKSTAKSTKTTVKTIKSNPAETEVQPTKSQTKTTSKPKSNPENTKKPFILIRPFVYFGRYVRDSWHEIRQVRWPSRKVTWKLFLAIVVYTAIFAAVIMLLDALFTWLFNTVLV